MILTFGSNPRVSYLSSGNSALAILIMSLHFFGVSSTLPARNKQQHAVSWNKNCKKMLSIKIACHFKLFNYIIYKLLLHF